MDFSVYIFISEWKQTISYDRNWFAHDIRNVFFTSRFTCFLGGKVKTKVI
jgi:hypothetical protein